ncbi:MAG: PEP-CTERM sorting domain-containing protein [Rubrivivax sp.]|nr:PEP-CTERM sorting domain-containing protein [Rubrivivax sp.]
MKVRPLATLAIGLLLGWTAAQAVPVESTTTTRLTMRDCIAGTTACDGIGSILHSGLDGSPGATSAATTLTNALFGSSSGSAQITGSGGSVLTANATSEAGKRNSANGGSLQRYTYLGASPTTLTFFASIAYDQTVPAENAGFDPANAIATFSGVYGGIEVFTITDSEIDAGVTDVDNFNTVFGGFTLAPGYLSLGSADTGALSNMTASGTHNLSVSFNVNAGQSVWLWALLQSPAAHGAVVDASMVTAVPEPGALALAGLSLALIGLARRNRH